MTEAQVIALIQQWIITNGNEEITANVLRPILEEITHQPNILIGDLDDLNTTATDNLVNAINSILVGNTGVTIHYGAGLPNDVPPVPTLLGDFYAQQSGSSILSFWQYNGNTWVEIKPLEVKTVFRFVSLVGITLTGKSIIEWAKEAINQAIADNGNFTCNVGEVMTFYFNFSEIPGFVGTPITVNRYYVRLCTGANICSNIGNEFLELMPDGRDDFQVIGDLVVDLGDIGTDEVEDAFNNDVNQPFAMTDEKFVQATHNGELKLWQWRGGVGSFGNGATLAIADDFLDLTEQPVIPTNNPLKNYPTISALLAGQAEQHPQQLYIVKDASADTNITFPSGETRLQATYRFRGDSETGTLSDYTLISAPYQKISDKRSPDLGQIVHPYGSGYMIDPIPGLLPLEIGNCFYDAEKGHFILVMLYRADPNVVDSQRAYLFTSINGNDWTNEGKISENVCEDPYMIKVNGKYYLYSEKRSGSSVVLGIDLTTSTDLVTWNYEGLILDKNPTASWDSSDVSSPTAIYRNGTFYLFFEGRGGSNLGAIGLATSTDGLNYTKIPNPVLKGYSIYPVLPPETVQEIQWASHVVCDDIIERNGKYYMTFHAYNSSGWVSGVAVSEDLTSWSDYLNTSITIGQGNDSLPDGLMFQEQEELFAYYPRRGGVIRSVFASIPIDGWNHSARTGNYPYGISSGSKNEVITCNTSKVIDLHPDEGSSTGIQKVIRNNYSGDLRINPLAGVALYGLNDNGYLVIKKGQVVTLYMYETNSWTVLNTHQRDSAVVIHDKITLSASEIKTLNTTPIELLDAPGVGYAIGKVDCYFRLNFNTTPFDFAGGTKIQVRVESAANLKAEINPNNINSPTTNIFDTIITVSSGISSVENKKLMLESTADATSGDSTIDIYLTYEIIPL